MAFYNELLSRHRSFPNRHGYGLPLLVTSMLPGIGGFEMKLKSSTSISLAFALAILILHSNALSQAPSPQKAADPNPSNVGSKISIYDLESKSIRVVYTADKLGGAELVS